MDIKELIDSVRGDVKQNAYEKAEIIELCDKLEEIIEENNRLKTELMMLR